MNGPVEDPTKKWAPVQLTGTTGRYPHTHPNTDYEQPRTLFKKVMTETDRQHLIENICGSLGGARRDVILIYIHILFRSKKEWLSYSIK